MDHFLFGTECQLRNWFGWVYGVLGGESLAFDDGGVGKKGLLARQKDRLQEVYMNFFRSGKRHRNNPAYVWIWGCSPLGAAPQTPELATSIHEKKLAGFKIYSNDDRWGSGPIVLELMENRTVDLAAGFLAVPEKKLSKAIMYRRWRETEDLRTGKKGALPASA